MEGAAGEVIVTVKYSCSKCDLHRIDVDVPARTTEDVNAWVERVMIPILMKDHGARSPFCSADSFDEVMIPITGASKVGGVVEN